MYLSRTCCGNGKRGKGPSIQGSEAKYQAQVTRALVLIYAAGVNVPEKGCGIPEIEKFQKYLTSYQIIVYQYGNKGASL